MQVPEVPSVILAGHLGEAVVVAQVVPDGALPGGPPLAIVGELLKDVLADLPKSEHLVGRLRDGHCHEGNVGIGWPVVLVALGGGVGLAGRWFGFGSSVLRQIRTRGQAGGVGILDILIMSPLLHWGLFIEILWTARRYGGFHLHEKWWRMESAISSFL